MSETNTMAVRLALRHLRRIKARRAAYEEECREWARQGYRPHYCIHGTNQWTDYDNICGPCEESLTDYELALQLGHADYREFRRRLEVCTHAREAGVPDEIFDRLGEWSFSILEEK